MRIYQDLFDIFQITAAQILLTRDDLSDRVRYLNARDTLGTLIEQRIIPIVNENDTIATEEIRVGDNDNLSALVARVVDADLLIILTDQPGIFTDDPRKNPEAALIQNVEQVSDELFALAGGAGSKAGTGGMVTKIQAAQIASRSGIETIIASGSEVDVVRRLVAGEQVGTRIAAGQRPIGEPQTLALDRPPRRERSWWTRARRECCCGAAPACCRSAFARCAANLSGERRWPCCGPTGAKSRMA